MSAETYALITGGLASEEPQFPIVDFDECVRMGAMSLKKLQVVPSISQLKRSFADAGLQAQFGFSQSASSIFVTISLPRATPTLSTSASAMLWCLLGVLPDQHAVEQRHARAHADKSPANDQSLPSHLHRSYTNADSDFTRLLANECLALFMRQTRMAIMKRQMDLRLNYVTLHFENAARGIQQRDGALLSDALNTPYWFNTSYTKFLGFEHFPDTNELKFSDATFQLQKSVIVASMVRQFWHLVEQRRYYPDPVLRKEVDEFITEYFDNGLKSQEASFSPKKQSLSLYLHGGAGLGKSTFVRLFTDTLKAVVHQHIGDASKRFNVIKVPLNSITPTELRKILHVQGISDWSVERIVEQTIARGGIAVLHLEENPEEPELQETLFAMTQQLLNVVVSRYPEYHSNLLYFITSNYAPADAIAKVAKPIHVYAPSEAEQMEWRRHVIADTLREHLTVARAPTAPVSTASTDATTTDSDAITTVAESTRSLPPLCPRQVVLSAATVRTTSDMRLLEKWKFSVGFLICAHLRGQWEQICENHLSLVEQQLALDEIAKKDANNDNGESESDFTSERTCYVDVQFSGTVNRIEVTFALVPSSSISIAPIVLASTDGYFYFQESAKLLHESQGDNSAANSLVEIGAEDAAKLAMVCDLLTAKLLSPAVIVLSHVNTKKRSNSGRRSSNGASSIAIANAVENATGGGALSISGSAKAKEQGNCLAKIQEFVRNKIGNKNLNELSLEAKCIEDQQKLFGNPSSPTSTGLLGYIDSLTNRNFPCDFFAMITVEVNEIGQFMLREILENHITQTHRTTVSKDRILFMVDVTEGSLSPQLYSRAHHVITIDDSLFGR